jgi:hypothetical protein
MGKLKPGVTYIYERASGVTYAREFGAPHSERFEVGRTASQIELDEHNLWIKIRQTAKTNKALQEEVDRVIMLYHLIKENG